jgi:VWFA-related protein
MTPDLARVDAALQSTHAHGSTALYDAIYITLRQYQQERLAFSEVRRHVMVLLSDGVDTASHVTFDDVLEVVRRAGVTLYIVSLAPDPGQMKGARAERTSFESAYVLSALARESGGRIFNPRGARELPAVYDAIRQELDNQYVIGYVPAAQGTNGLFRHVSVGILQPRAGLARTRAGYYADAVAAGDSVSSPRIEPGLFADNMPVAENYVRGSIGSAVQGEANGLPLDSADRFQHTSCFN